LRVAETTDRYGRLLSARYYRLELDVFVGVGTLRNDALIDGRCNRDRTQLDALNILAVVENGADAQFDLLVDQGVGVPTPTALSAIDEFGRYAYANQPAIAQWNLARFAETLLPLMDPNSERAVDLANGAISAFASRFQEHWLAGMRDKLGISGNEDGDLELVRALLQAMHENAADFTLTFRRLCDAAADEKADADARSLFADPSAHDSWAARWRSRLVLDRLEPNARAQAMRNVNPAFIPRNHRVEHALSAAIEYEDFSRFAALLAVLLRPYEDQEAFADYAKPPQTSERVSQTFCGT
jgi:serine/tyrosine/threonine adenylyltransferase